MLAGQIGMAAGTILSIKILTFVLDPSEFGRLMLANTVVILIHTNLFGPFTNSLMRFWSISAERNDIRSFDSAAAFYMTAICAVVLTGIGVMMISTIFVRQNWGLLVIISLMVGAVTGLSNIRIYIFMAARRQKTVAILNSALTIIKPLSGAFLVWIFIGNAETAMAGFLLTVVAIWGIAEFCYSGILKESVHDLPENGQVKQNYNVRKEILTYAYPFFIWGIFSWIFQFCDRWALQTYYGPEVVGAFAVISQIAVYPLIFFSGFLINLFMPVVYQKAGKLDSQASVTSANKMLFMMIGLYAMLSVILISAYAACHRFIITIISNVFYVGFSHLLPWLTLAWSFFYLGQILAGFGFLANKPDKYIPPIIVSGLTALALSFYLSPRFGAPGVVAALNISGGIYAAWFLIIAVRFVKISAYKKQSGVIR